MKIYISVLHVAVTAQNVTVSNVDQHEILKKKKFKKLVTMHDLYRAVLFKQDRFKRRLQQSFGSWKVTTQILY